MSPFKRYPLHPLWFKIAIQRISSPLIRLEVALVSALKSNKGSKSQISSQGEIARIRNGPWSQSDKTNVKSMQSHPTEPNSAGDIPIRTKQLLAKALLECIIILLSSSMGSLTRNHRTALLCIMMVKRNVFNLSPIALQSNVSSSSAKGEI